ncbi:TIGR04222 domain-containing membrane protein [Actinomadura sp. NPDC049753]|uniref:TIGR04222 domain-containing membrane protein n=1 Tax=Actinomadura sp. NPDC049753 TaxID=3154739 RepID=UPI0034384080
MADEILGPALGFLAAHLLVGLVLLAILRRMRAAVRRGRPPARDLHPYEVAYLRGGGRHAIAASITALRLDGAVDAYADGRLLATEPSASGPRAAGTPLDAAVFGAVAHLRAGTLAELTAEPGVRAALDQLRDGLAAQGMVLAPAGRRRLRNLQAVMFGWMMLGFVAFVMNDAFSGFPAKVVPIAELIGLGFGAIGLASGAERTREGELAVERAEESRRALDPANEPSYAGLPAPDALMGVALFGTAALMALDPMFAQTVGLGRYLEMAGVAAASGGHSGSSCSSTASVCSSSSCGGGGSCGGGSGCGGGSDCGGGGGGCGGGGCGGGS